MTLVWGVPKELFGHLVDGDRLGLLFRGVVRIPVEGDITSDLVACFRMLPELVGFREAQTPPEGINKEVIAASFAPVVHRFAVSKQVDNGSIG